MSVTDHTNNIYEYIYIWTFKYISCDAQYFYEEQLHRMECLAQEPVLFEDVLCQVRPQPTPPAYTSVTHTSVGQMSAQRVLVCLLLL